MNAPKGIPTAPIQIARDDLVPLGGESLLKSAPIINPNPMKYGIGDLRTHTYKLIP